MSSRARNMHVVDQNLALDGERKRRSLRLAVSVSRRAVVMTADLLAMPAARFCLLLCIVTLPMFAQTLHAQGEFPSVGRVTGDRIRVRTGPSKNHFAFCEIQRGAEIIVHEAAGEWLRCSLPPYLPMWIHGDYLNELDATRGQVIGQKVRLRATPGTKHAHLGFATLGEKLKLTGKRDKTETWVQCYGTLATRVAVHRDFVTLSTPVDVQQLPTLFRGLRAPKGGTATARIAPAMSKVVSERLLELQDNIVLERAKQVLEWNFEPFKDQLARIVRDSEDIGEAQLARQMISQINDEILPFQAKFIENQRKADEARSGLASGREEEKNIGKSVHAPSRREQKYLAVGWILGMGTAKPVEGCTHKLKKGNQVLFYLKSDKFDLDRYVNKRIGIQGTLRIIPGEAAKLITVTDIQVLSK